MEHEEVFNDVYNVLASLIGTFQYESTTHCDSQLHLFVVILLQTKLHWQYLNFSELKFSK